MRYSIGWCRLNIGYHRLRFLQGTPQNLSPKNQSPPLHQMLYIPMACVKSEKLNNRNQEVNLEYLLFFFILYSSLELFPSVVVHFWNLFFFLDFRCPKHKMYVSKWCTLSMNNSIILKAKVDNFIWSSGQPIFDYLLCTLYCNNI